MKRVVRSPIPPASKSALTRFFNANRLRQFSSETAALAEVLPLFERHGLSLGEFFKDNVPSGNVFTGFELDKGFRLYYQNSTPAGYFYITHKWYDGSRVPYPTNANYSLYYIHINLNYVWN